MASPLAPYINARVLFPGVATITRSGGRFIENQATFYLVKAFIKRAQYSGVSSGSKKIPLESQLDGQMMPGASGDQFYYRGYALEFTSVASDWDLETSDETGLVFAQVTAQFDWMKTGTEVSLRFGNDPIMLSRVQRSSGIFGGEGIDTIIYSEIGGVELQLTAGEVQN